MPFYPTEMMDVKYKIVVNISTKAEKETLGVVLFKESTS